MAKPLSYQPLPNFGINGLNTQRNPSTLDSSWLTKADNVVLRESGRISFRKGFKQKVLKTIAKIGSLTEHNDQGTNKIFAASGTSIYTIDFTDPPDAFPSSGADVKHTVTGAGSDWQFVNFNKRLHCFQTGVVPQRYDGSLSSGSRWTAHATKPATITTFDPSCGMGFYGRVWVGGVSEEKSVVFHSNLLDGDDWTGGDASSINLNKVWGNDEIVALAPFYGKLVVFGKNNIAIYNSPETVGSITLDEVIRGVGCVSRDSVQAIADDLVFLSNTGLRSLGRTTEKDKLPLTDYSVNIKDTLIRNIAQSSNVKSVYVESEGIYIMTFVDKNITYVFDFKHITPNGVPRVTTWSFDSDREPASMAYTNLYGLLVGQQEGSIAGYEGYFDSDYGITIAAASFLGIPEATPPTHSTTEKKIGASSIYFSDVADFFGNNHLKIDAAKLGKGTGDFTVEGWFKPTNEAASTDSRWDTIPSGYEMALFTWGRNSNNIPKTRFYYNDNEFKFYYNGSTYNTLTGSAHGLTGDSWAHLAVTKSGNTITIWVNGVSKGSTTTDTDIDFTENEYTGGYYPYEAMLCADWMTGSSQGFTGYLDEIRFSKVARYTTGFTPSTTAFEKDDDTLILIHSDESTSGSSTFVDSSESQVNFPYTADISSPWIELGQTMSASLLKKMILVLEGGSGATLGLKWYKDFSSISSATTTIILNPTTTGSTSLWGDATSLYDTSTYSPIFGLQEYKTPLTGSAKHLKLNISIESNGYDSMIQNLTLLHKEGKIR